MDEKKKTEEPSYSANMKQMIDDFSQKAKGEMEKENSSKVPNRKTEDKDKRRKKRKRETSSDEEGAEGSADSPSDGSDDSRPPRKGSSADKGKGKVAKKKPTKKDHWSSEHQISFHQSFVMNQLLIQLNQSYCQICGPHSYMINTY